MQSRIFLVLNPELVCFPPYACSRPELLGKSGGRSPEPAFSIFFIPLVTFVFPCSFYVEYKNPELATKESLSKGSPLFSSHQWA